jgi:hypothetical protein
MTKAAWGQDDRIMNEKETSSTSEMIDPSTCFWVQFTVLAFGFLSILLGFYSLWIDLPVVKSAS